MAKLVFASLYFSTPAATTLSAATPAKAAGTTTKMKTAEFTHTTGRLTHNGLNARTFNVLATLTLSKAAGTASAVTMSIRKNAAAVTGARVNLTIADTAEHAVALAAQIDMATNDYLEIWLETDTGDDITVEDGTLVVSVAG